MADGIDEARAAFARQAWEPARRQLSVLAEEDALSFDDLHRLATAAYMTGRDEAAFQLWAQGHRDAVDRSDFEWAARFGVVLAQSLGFKGDIARSRGWIDRTRRILDDAELDCVEQGYVEHGTAMCRIFEAGDIEGAGAHFARAARTADRFGDRELAALARIGQGRCLIYLGEITAGVALLDEAMVAVENRELSSLAVGDAYCTVIDACYELFDVHRCRSWTESFTEWCDAQPDLVLYRGHCLLHRAEIMALRGTWSDALVEAQQACARLAAPSNPTLGGAHLVEGDLYRLQGRFDEAEASYRQANELGCQPQPGRSLLRLAQGQTDAADASIRRALAETGDPIGRARLLAAYAEIVLTAGDTGAAKEAADELDRLASNLQSSFLRAQARHAIGAILLSEERATDALVELRAAWTSWNELEVPYEAARTRLLIAAACRMLGDLDTADLELHAAQTTLAALGAPPPVADLRASRCEPPDGLSGRELEVLELLAQGKTNRVIAEELFISEKTVASHVSHIFTKLGLSSRSAATAYAYEQNLL